ncbi:MAG: TMEM175 family protein [Actinomycetota bacterium]|nr:TMEM175 family protein [Actinomycetota bacterium]MDP2287660.1 TMEM175 family protein [Actinomycetota bacterium]
MSKGRLEAFSDAVIAILITIMVLELRPPESADWASLEPVLPVFLTYVLSFIYLAIYWNNHHHLLQAATRVTGGVLWANFNLLFWLSLFPFATGWMGLNHFEPIPTAVYGGVLMMAAIAFYILLLVIIRAQGTDSEIAAVLGSNIKGKISPIIYALGIVLAFVQPWIAVALYVLVAGMWLVPDRKLERAFNR